MNLIAYSILKDSSAYPELKGMVHFFRTSLSGLYIEIEVYGLPETNHAISSGFFGLHIHEKGNCTPPFDQTGAHYNPINQPHPYHAGDLPPLLSNNGFAYMLVYTNRLTADNIIGKSIVIHSSPDDFTSQPAGNSGEKIACGEIKAFTEQR